jgi:hypothetical protein
MATVEPVLDANAATFITPQGLPLRRRLARRRQGHAGIARRQGWEPRRDGVDRTAGAPGFTITTAMCAEHNSRTMAYHEKLPTQMISGLRHIETATCRRFGDASDPLLVSVRSGARA